MAEFHCPYLRQLQANEEIRKVLPGNCAKIFDLQNALLYRNFHLKVLMNFTDIYKSIHL